MNPFISMKIQERLVGVVSALKQISARTLAKDPQGYTILPQEVLRKKVDVRRSLMDLVTQLEQLAKLNPLDQDIRSDLNKAKQALSLL